MRLRGVNLGGWLVLERWITPELFEGLEAQDEYSFCQELGDKKEKVLQSHWKSFITDEDLRWIAKTGLNAVRIPVGYWVFGDIQPYAGSIDRLDWVMEAAAKHSLKVIIDLHGAPGSQNGLDHSGKSGTVGWHKQSGNIAQTIEVIAKLADRYKNSPTLAGIELLNEPSHGLPKRVVLDYYQSAYQAARNSLSDDKAIVISDSFRPKKWKGELTGKDYKNVWLDMHLYQCFDKADKKLDIAGHLAKTKEQGKLIQSIRKRRPVMIGEWSLGLDPESFGDMAEKDQSEAIKVYAHVQIETYKQADSWFFWTYKTSRPDGWNFRHIVEAGLMPSLGFS